MRILLWLGAWLKYIPVYTISSNNISALSLVDYDNKTGRSARYWRDMNYYKADQLYSDEIDKLHQFGVHDPDYWQKVPVDGTCDASGELFSSERAESYSWFI